MTMISTVSQMIPTSPTPILRNENGYAENRFEGKAEQMLAVSSHIESKGLIPVDLVKNEVAWFYG